MQKINRVCHSILLFFLAGIFEIGGGYLVWLWLREDYSWVVGAIGGFLLFLYGVVPTFHKTHFHRIYAAYGGIFVLMALLWGWWIDGLKPDIYDVVGVLVILFGVIVIFYFPRRKNV